VDAEGRAVSASDTRPSRTQRRADWASRAVPIEAKIIMLTRGRAERLLVAQRMSTGSGGDCEISFFPDDSDVRATEPWPIAPFRALAGGDRQRSRSRDWLEVY
jgi:hypothetical protein